ncbi:hypothetical protein [Ammoniphilus sp. 3BR4]|uniref:hypothetical protein n=1 Tax=Ammoniphilus sp. 3BR4 TaxID=3158265 RepID=UPI003465DFCE
MFDLLFDNSFKVPTEKGIHIYELTASWSFVDQKHLGSKEGKTIHYGTHYVFAIEVK